MTPDATLPFYGFFDPEANGDIGFDINANWEQDSSGLLNSMTNKMSKLPVVGSLAGKAAGALSSVSNVANTLVKTMGMDNTSTGSCTMKSFSKASFAFNKSIKCSWYMPEQEAQARVSITRLLKMAYVRNFDLNSRSDYSKKIAEAFRAMTQQMESFNMPEDSASGFAGGVLNDLAHLAAGVTETFGGSIDTLVSGAIGINEFFGGSLTVAPMPLRLTLGHILDIEPVVITGIKVYGSKEQFMTTDGTNIPLFVNADISFDMWMIPDPNKGFVRWLGDDVFNIGYTNAVSESTKKDQIQAQGQSTNSKSTGRSTRKATGTGSKTENPPTHKGGK
ncbi:MAG: hypothetical protein IKA48_02250 [Fibrobacter sp.]|nr:hypothetical protein [Fibrobacter sp.]